MAISLFPHNQTAYEAALEMMQRTGKAAVIHPTGTGKSFLGFKLCEEFPKEKICWVSPSEYIFRTQLENLAAAGAEKPENIRFFTYAKLRLLSEEEMAEICPSYIILDEFHRCGAKAWGQGVANLLKVYPQAMVLGLSATAIRYLDNQRDMSDGFFLTRKIWRNMRERSGRQKAKQSGTWGKSSWRASDVRWNRRTDWRKSFRNIWQTEQENILSSVPIITICRK